MAAGVRDLRFFPTQTELHALLLEDQLIKAHHPPYNRRQKKELRQCYLTLGPGNAAAPAVTAQPRGRWAFGPFRDVHYAGELAALASRYFGLGPATPTRTPASRDRRAAAGFLSGESDEVLHRIRAEVLRHREALAFELAAAARDRLRFCQAFLPAQRFFQDFKHRTMLVEDLARGGRCFFIFVRGSLRHHARGRPPRLCPPLEPGPAEPDAHLFDRAALLRAWLSAGAETRRCTVMTQGAPVRGLHAYD
jgi:excinuclease UvrABC nuclease subunit